MKTNKLIFIFICASLTILQSCKLSENYRVIEKTSTRDLQGRGSDANVIVKPVLAELDIQKTRTESTFSYSSDTLGGNKSKISLNTNSKETAKNLAMFQYLKLNQCDYVLDPLYFISRSGSSDSNIEDINVTISGYPAKYKSFIQPDTLPRSISEARNLSRGTVLIANSQTITKEEFKPFFAAGLGFNFGFAEGALGLPDLHARYYASRFLSLGYDFMNMKDYYGTTDKPKNHIFSGNLNLYNKNLNGIHFTGGLEMPTYDGIADFDGFGIMFGIGSQFIVADKFAIRADYRASSTFGGSFGLGVSYCFRK
jgi:hypothetical protein